MDIKSEDEIFIKEEELLDNAEDFGTSAYYLDQTLGLEDNEQKNCSPKFKVKSEVEVNDSLVDTEKEGAGNGQVFEKNSGSSEFQTFMCNAGEGEEDSKVNLRKKPQRMNSSEKRRRICLDTALKIILCPGGDSDDDLDKNDGEENDEKIPDASLISRIDSQTQEDFEKVFEQQLEQNKIEIEPMNSDSDDDEDSFLFNQPISSRNSKNKMTVPKWRKKEFSPPEDIDWKDSLVVEEGWKNKPPIFFFNLIFGEATINHICKQTNIYALQSAGKEIKVSLNEMKAYIGILLISGVFTFPSFRLFWNKKVRYEPISDVMPRNRFEEIKRFLHFNDNTEMKPQGHPNFDKGFKIRPVWETVRNNCLSIPPEEHQVVDEQIIPTKSKISLKRYNAKKSPKWGYKVISRAGESGFVYDIHLYTGKNTTSDINTELGIAPGFVMKLAEGIPKHKNYKIFYDNWFSSFPLAIKLKENGILALSTIRPSRLKGCNLEEDSRLKKGGRDGFDYRVDEISNSIIIKWQNNKPVHLLSTYAGIDPCDTCKRWDGKQRKHVEIQRPFAVNEYNKFIGGVDLFDMLLELYRIDHKSTKWYMRIFYYLLDLSVVNGWILYRRVCKASNIQYMPLLDFKLDIGDCLTKSEHEKRKRSGGSSVYRAKKRPRIKKEPSISSRFDTVGHIPEYVNKRHRCKYCTQAQTKIWCIKCRVGLCLTSKRNCFREFHS